jgi:hypothetical protein
MVDKDEVERIAKHAWGAAQRIGMQISVAAAHVGYGEIDVVN